MDRGRHRWRGVAFAVAPGTPTVRGGPRFAGFTAVMATTRTVGSSGDGDCSLATYQRPETSLTVHVRNRQVGLRMRPELGLSGLRSWLRVDERTSPLDLTAGGSLSTRLSRTEPGTYWAPTGKNEYSTASGR